MARASEVSRPAIGYRLWRIDPGGIDGRDRLYSLLSDTEWPLRRPLAAVCESRLVPPWQRRQAFGIVRHPAPLSRCSCGAYAYHALDAMLTHARRFSEAAPRPVVVGGAVLAWGRITIHPEGLRAEHMRPLAVWLPGLTPTSRDLELGVRRIGRAYAIPALDTEHLAIYAGEFGIDYRPPPTPSPAARVAARLTVWWGRRPRPAG